MYTCGVTNKTSLRLNRFVGDECTKRGVTGTYETFVGFARPVAHREHVDVDLDVNNFPRIAYPGVLN